MSNNSAFFVAMRSSILSSPHSRLFESQPRLDDQIVQDSQRKTPKDYKLPRMSLILKALQGFCREINPLSYVLDYERTKARVLALSSPDLKPTHALLGIIFSLSSLEVDEDEMYIQANHYVYSSMAESSIESVQALVLLVSDSSHYVEHYGILMRKLGILSPVPGACQSRLDHHRLCCANSTISRPSSRRSERCNGN